MDASLGKGLPDALHTQLVERGVLREESGRILGLFPIHGRPATDAAHENDLRDRLVQTLRVGATDDVRVSALVALLRALPVIPKVVDPATAGIAKRSMKAYAKKAAEGSWEGRDVRKATDEIVAAAVAATTSATVLISGS